MKKQMVVLLAVFAACIAWADTWTDSSGNVWTYSVSGESATVSAVSFETTTLVIPDTLGGKPVTGFTAATFGNRTRAVRVTIPATVTAIPDRAFEGCENLKSVTIQGEGLTSIGATAFKGCGNLDAFVMPNSVTSLGRGAFSGCSAMTSVTLSDGLETLTGVPYTNYYGDYGDYDDSTNLRFDYDKALFYNCTSLRTINWGKNIKTIGNIAFLNCSALTDIVLPASITDIGNHAFFGCSSLKTVVVTGNVNYIGRYAFGNCPALHYVDFRGATMTSAPGYMPFKFDRDVVTAYAAAGSKGWMGVADQAGLPESGTWGGARITYAPPPEGAANPYDFYPYIHTDTISRVDYPWSLMVTTNRYENGRTVPVSLTTIREGDPVYLTYAFNEYWRGAAFTVTNRFTLSGTKTGTFDLKTAIGAHSTSDFFWTTNAAPTALQNLAPGNYTLALQLNAGNRLKETDYSNNTTSITFKVVAVPKYTVTFNLNGASGTAPAARTVREGAAIGELPTVTWSGRTFLGWYVGDTRITAATPVTANMTCTARWQGFDIIFWKPLDMTWKDTMFVNSSSYANEMQTTFKEGDPIYFYYACYEAGWQTLRTSFVNRFRLIGDNNVVKSEYHDVLGIWSGTCEGIYGSKVNMLQGLLPGTYTIACTLDADGDVVETNEVNNTKSITFTVVPAGATLYTVTFSANGGSVSPTTRTVASGAVVGTLPTPTRSGYSFAGWFTSSSGGTQVTASTKVTANVTYYSHWSASGVYPPGSQMPVTIISGSGKTKTITVVVGQAWGSNLPAAPTPPSGQTFVGWYTGKDGKGTHVTATSIVPERPVSLYPYFVDRETYCLCASVVGAVPLAAASEYGGYLYDVNGAVVGTIQVKVGKANAKTGLAAVKATVVGLDGKKKSLKAAEKGKATISEDGPTMIKLVGGEPCEVTLGAEGLSGFYGNYEIDGARNFFTSKDKGEQNAANGLLASWLGPVNVVWDDGNASVAIGKKGKVKVYVTLANGTKAMVNTQLLIGEEWLCVPVVVTKKMNLAFTLWLPRNGGAAVVEGLSSDAVVGKAGALKAGAKFHIDADAFSARWGQSALPYLPDGVAVTANGTRWTLPKAGKVQMAKAGTVDEAKLGGNPAALKLTYKAKDGSFKGSFKAYSLVNGKPKAVTVNVAGVVVSGVGYGTATIKKVVSVPISIE